MYLCEEGFSGSVWSDEETFNTSSSSSSSRLTVGTTDQSCESNVHYVRIYYKKASFSKQESSKKCKNIFFAKFRKFFLISPFSSTFYLATFQNVHKNTFMEDQRFGQITVEEAHVQPKIIIMNDGRSKRCAGYMITD